MSTGSSPNLGASPKMKEKRKEENYRVSLQAQNIVKSQASKSYTKNIKKRK
jgi:hypothetical protein